ncbi:uncharacterized protein LOC142853029 [Microtus pennsylvanicus]|uniref:uncharacterized protein LOC142853029 n=1 Tax=Microtus pennsylvanicus TaxID=10058 RepID=UPI003F6B04B1
MTSPKATGAIAPVTGAAPPSATKLPPAGTCNWPAIYSLLWKPIGSGYTGQNKQAQLLQILPPPPPQASRSAPAQLSLRSLSSTGTLFLHPPSHCLSRHSNRIRARKRAPPGTTLPTPPHFCSLTGPSRRRTLGLALAARLLLQPPGAAGPVGSPGLAGGTAGDPGLLANATPPRWQTRARPAALRLQPGRTAPTLRLQRRPRDMALPPPGPVPPFRTPTASCQARFSRSPSRSAKETETPPNAPLERSSRFRELIHDHHGGEHGGRQAEVAESSTCRSAGSRKSQTLGLV